MLAAAGGYLPLSAAAGQAHVASFAPAVQHRALPSLTPEVGCKQKRQGAGMGQQTPELGHSGRAWPALEVLEAETWAAVHHCLRQQCPKQIGQLKCVLRDHCLQQTAWMILMLQIWLWEDVAEMGLGL